MGQYHMVVNLDKKEFINPHRAGDGLKLFEFVPWERGTMMCLGALLANDSGMGGGDFAPSVKVASTNKGLEHVDYSDGWIGRWAGDRIAIVGDYQDLNDELVPEEWRGRHNIYGLCNDCDGDKDHEDHDRVFTDVTDDILRELRKDEYLAKRIVNPDEINNTGWRRRPEPEE